jgi:hypothetical protein
MRSAPGFVNWWRRYGPAVAGARAETLDPFTQAYQAIRDALQGWSGFAALVKEANWDDFTEFARQNAKGGLMPADAPTASLVPTTFTLRPFGSNSKVSQIEHGFQLVTATDVLKVLKVNAVKYQTLVALVKAGDDLGLPGLVSDWNVTGGQDGTGTVEVAGSDTLKGRKGFASILSINVVMTISRATLLAL